MTRLLLGIIKQKNLLGILNLKFCEYSPVALFNLSHVSWQVLSPGAEIIQYSAISRTKFRKLLINRANFTKSSINHAIFDSNRYIDK
uniref:Uncharacterized protein n=1 Tax=Romanomermis culicivorax TaxID=13658 RepID=A0A915LE28_ROMCU